MSMIIMRRFVAVPNEQEKSLLRTKILTFKTEFTMNYTFLTQTSFLFHSRICTLRTEHELFFFRTRRTFWTITTFRMVIGSADPKIFSTFIRNA